MRNATIYLSDDQDLEHVICRMVSVDPDTRPALVKVLDDGTLRLAVRSSREVEVAELVEAGVVQVDEAAGYTTVPCTG